jgi:hypothetical protein
MMREQTSRCKHYTHTGFDGVGSWQMQKLFSSAPPTILL